MAGGRLLICSIVLFCGSCVDDVMMCIFGSFVVGMKVSPENIISDLVKLARLLEELHH